MTDVTNLSKRQRLALRSALANPDTSGCAPSVQVRALVRLGLVTKTGHVHETMEWGKVVRRAPCFVLTAAGEAAARACLALLAEITS